MSQLDMRTRMNLVLEDEMKYSSTLFTLLIFYSCAIKGRTWTEVCLWTATWG